MTRRSSMWSLAQHNKIRHCTLSQVLALSAAANGSLAHLLAARRTLAASLSLSLIELRDRGSCASSASQVQPETKPAISADLTQLMGQSGSVAAGASKRYITEKQRRERRTFFCGASICWAAFIPAHSPTTAAVPCQEAARMEPPLPPPFPSTPTLERRLQNTNQPLFLGASETLGDSGEWVRRGAHALVGLWGEDRRRRNA